MTTREIEYPTYGEKKTVRSIECGGRMVASVVFAHFDATLSTHHKLEVHWTQAFTYLRAHGEDVVAVRWAIGGGPFSGEASFASWKRGQDGRYRIVTGSSSYTVLEELTVTDTHGMATDQDPREYGFPGLDALKVRAAEWNATAPKATV